MDKMVLLVKGMSCSHCENAVKTALSGLPGVFGVEVNLTAKEVSISCDIDKISLDEVRNAILDQGYEVM